MPQRTWRSCTEPQRIPKKSCAASEVARKAFPVYYSGAGQTAHKSSVAAKTRRCLWSLQHGQFPRLPPGRNEAGMMAIQRAGIDSCPAIISFVDTRPARLRGCFCNAAGSPVRKGFMDKAAFAEARGVAFVSLRRIPEFSWTPPGCKASEG